MTRRNSKSKSSPVACRFEMFANFTHTHTHIHTCASLAHSSHARSHQVQAKEDVPNMLTLGFPATRSNPSSKTFLLLAEDVRSRDVVVLVLRALAA
jgi:hypothetical protein